MKKLLTWFDSVGKIVAGLTGLVVLITGATSLYFIFRPPPPKVEEASFEATRLQQFGPPTSLKAYFKLAGDLSLTERYKPDELSANGVYYTVPVTLLGMRGAQATLVWSLFRATDRAPVEDWVNQDAGVIKVPRDQYTYLVQVWIQLPQLPGNYIAVIQIRRGGQPLDSVTTQSFPGVIGPPRPPPTTTTMPTTTFTTPTTTTATTTTHPTTTVATTETTSTSTTTTTETTPTTTVNQPPHIRLIRPPAIITASPNTQG